MHRNRQTAQQPTALPPSEDTQRNQLKRQPRGLGLGVERRPGSSPGTRTGNASKDSHSCCHSLLGVYFESNGEQPQELVA